MKFVFEKGAEGVIERESLLPGARNLSVIFPVGDADDCFLTNQR
jgi:hypothetical protein